MMMDHDSMDRQVSRLFVGKYASAEGNYGQHVLCHFGQSTTDKIGNIKREMTSDATSYQLKEMSALSFCWTNASFPLRCWVSKGA